MNNDWSLSTSRITHSSRPGNRIETSKPHTGSQCPSSYPTLDRFAGVKNEKAYQQSRESVATGHRGQVAGRRRQTQHRTHTPRLQHAPGKPLLLRPRVACSRQTRCLPLVRSIKVTDTQPEDPPNTSASGHGASRGGRAKAAAGSEGAKVNITIVTQPLTSFGTAPRAARRGPRAERVDSRESRLGATRQAPTPCTQRRRHIALACTSALWYIVHRRTYLVRMRPMPPKRSESSRHVSYYSLLVD